MPLPDTDWLADNPWRTTIARVTVAELAPQYRARTIDRADEHRLIEEVGVIAVADALPRRHVWLRDVEADPRAELTYAAEQAVQHAETLVAEAYAALAAMRTAEVDA